MEDKLAQLEQSVKALNTELKELGEAISQGFSKTNSNFDNVSKQLLNLRQQLDLANKSIDYLKGETSEGFNEVGVKLETLTDEINKIGKVTGYDGMLENLKGFN